MSKKTIGVIGLGSIGLRHAENLTDMGHLLWPYDPDRSKLKEFGFHEGYAVKSAEDIFHLESLDSTFKPIDAVVIASPTDKHYEHIVAAVAAGKDIFCEKPITDFIPEIPNGFFHNIDAVDMVGYNLRFHSCVKKAKEWLDAGHIGKPLWANFVCAQYNDRPAYLRDGVTLNWSHEIDLSLYLLGPGSVSGSSTRLSDGKDDLTDILLTHENGCRSTIHLDYITRPEIRQSMIVGENATIIMDLVSRNAWLRGADGVIWDHLEGQDSWDKNYKDEMQAFIDRIDGKQTIGATGQEGLDVLKICLKVREQAGLK